MVIHDHDDISPLIINQTRDEDPRPLVVPSVLETLETRSPQSSSSDKLYRGVKNIYSSKEVLHQLIFSHFKIMSSIDIFQINF